eukprot:TRINITY_DN12966_c0_g1_i1.p3 TRINITY_DN12966_c0_g1~~TRINITY_DN12966_c0_g1_i1.p3  ORF type:complete len:104 (+),score=35.27 TRINITY_DN12966_c0_g1_i1:31-312(+)
MVFQELFSQLQILVAPLLMKFKKLLNSSKAKSKKGRKSMSIAMLEEEEVQWSSLPICAKRMDGQLSNRLNTSGKRETLQTYQGGMESFPNGGC